MSSDSQRAEAGRDQAGQTGGVLLLATVAVIGLNLRPFLTAVGPLATDIRTATGLGLQGMALLTLVPMLLMGLCAFAGSALQQRIGARGAVIGALVMLAAGAGLRGLAGSGAAVLAATALCGLGVAVVQAVFPGIVKRHFTHHVAGVMGLYSCALMGGGALGAQLAPMIARGAGNWHVGLGWIALPALAAIAMAVLFLPRDGRSAPAGGGTMALLRRPRTWLLMACFGLVNGGYSSVIAWLAADYQELGWSITASGGLLAVMAVSQATAALLLPLVARRSDDRRPFIWLTLAMQAIGFAGLALRPEAAPFAWSMLAGAGLGGCFALTMVVALDHLPDPGQAGALSALMQGGGFLIAAIPPAIVAALHEASGGFAAGWLFHLGCVAIVTLLIARLRPRDYPRAMGGLKPAC